MVVCMRISYGFNLTAAGMLAVNKGTANIAQRIFDYFLAGSGPGKVVDMLYAKQIPSPTMVLM